MNHKTGLMINLSRNKMDTKWKLGLCAGCTVYYEVRMRLGFRIWAVLIVFGKVSVCGAYYGAYEASLGGGVGQD